jgi:chemotaxis protein MotA
MDIATLIGIIIAGGLVISAILMGGSAAWFINTPSLMIVIGGTMGATLLNYPLSEIFGVFRVAKNVLIQRSSATGSLVLTMVDFAKKARREGILSFESEIKNLKDPFMANGLQLAIDGMESNAIEEIMRTEIMFLEERHRLGAEIFATMGAFAPAVGMLGTIIGLVQMLMQMKDPSQIGAPMAVALLTTFYGTVLAYLVFLPISGKLKTKSKQEILEKQMVLEGIVAIQSGDNHRIVEQKLKAFLSPKVRDSESPQLSKQ